VFGPLPTSLFAAACEGRVSYAAFKSVAYNRRAIDRPNAPIAAAADSHPLWAAIQ
jgi:hypothetical protein